MTTLNCSAGYNPEGMPCRFIHNRSFPRVFATSQRASIIFRDSFHNCQAARYYPQSNNHPLFRITSMTIATLIADVKYPKVRAILTQILAGLSSPVQSNNGTSAAIAQVRRLLKSRLITQELADALTAALRNTLA